MRDETKQMDSAEAMEQLEGMRQELWALHRLLEDAPMVSKKVGQARAMAQITALDLAQDALRRSRRAA